MVVVRSSSLLPGVWLCDFSFVQSRSDPVCFQVVGFTTVRMSNRDLSLDDGKLIIPRNANIFLPVGLPHMSSAVYKDADQFLPERWLEPDADYMPGGLSEHNPTLALGFVQQNVLPVAALYDRTFDRVLLLRAYKRALTNACKRAQPLPVVVHGTGFQLNDL